MRATAVRAGTAVARKNHSRYSALHLLQCTVCDFWFLMLWKCNERRRFETFHGESVMRQFSCIKVTEIGFIVWRLKLLIVKNQPAWWSFCPVAFCPRCYREADHSIVEFLCVSAIHEIRCCWPARRFPFGNVSFISRLINVDAIHRTGRRWRTFAVVAINVMSKYAAFDWWWWNAPTHIGLDVV